MPPSKTETPWIFWDPFSAKTVGTSALGLSVLSEEYSKPSLIILYSLSLPMLLVFALNTEFDPTLVEEPVVTPTILGRDL